MMVLAVIGCNDSLNDAKATSQLLGVRVRHRESVARAEAPSANVPRPSSMTT